MDFFYIRALEISVFKKEKKKEKKSKHEVVSKISDTIKVPDGQ